MAKKTAKDQVPPEIANERERRRSVVWTATVNYLGKAGVIAACVLPLRWVYYCVRDLAGRTTTASLGVTMTLSVAGLTGLTTAFVMNRKSIAQRDELVRLRERCANLEKQLDERKSARK